MTLGELRDKLAGVSEETDLESEVWFGIDEYNSKLVKDVFIDFETGEVVLK